ARRCPMTSRSRSFWRKIGQTRWTSQMSRTRLSTCSDRNVILGADHDRTCFNLVLPPDTILKLDGSSSLSGLGGYHGSVHFSRGGQRRTLYYSANVYSAIRAGRRNGIPFFSNPWKNVVCTLYHELIEFQ